MQLHYNQSARAHHILMCAAIICYRNHDKRIKKMYGVWNMAGMITKFTRWQFCFRMPCQTTFTKCLAFYSEETATAIQFWVLENSQVQCIGSFGMSANLFFMRGPSLFFSRQSPNNHTRIKRKQREGETKSCQKMAREQQDAVTYLPCSYYHFPPQSFRVKLTPPYAQVAHEQIQPTWHGKYSE